MLFLENEVRIIGLIIMDFFDKMNFIISIANKIFKRPNRDMKFVYAQFILMFVFACGNEQLSNKVSSANVVVMDSVNKNFCVSSHKVVQDPFIDSLVNYFEVISQLPMSISAKNIDTLKPKLKLRAYEVKKISGKFIQGVLSKKCEYYIHRFCKIDSIKQLGEYKSWKLQTELGEIINADA